MTLHIRYSPFDIAAALATVDSRVRTPTAEQALIIAALLEQSVVISGAVSGKTMTISARFLYIVANMLVMPHKIQVLRFSFKSAGVLVLPKPH